MREYRRSLFGLLVILPLLLASVQSARGSSVIMLSDRELAIHSRVIIVGQIESVFSATGEDSITWTYVEVRNERTVKGEVPEGRIALRQQGGGTAFAGMRVFGQPEFERGQRVLLYLNTAPDGSLRIAHLFMGLFLIERDSLTGRDVVIRNSRPTEIEIHSRPDSQKVTYRAYFDEHIQEIREILSTEAELVREVERSREDEPLLLFPLEYTERLNSSSRIVPGFTFIGGGIRWMQADNDQPISFFVNPENAPVPGGGLEELTRAMDAWAAQSGARLRLVFGGQTASCGVVVDGLNAISFNDCRRQLDPPVGCAGVIAMTSVRWINESKVIGGLVFNRITEADVVFNSGMDCFLSQSASLAEVACHEIGHAIGLGHSADSSALMWSVASGGRDAVLGDDDKAGVLAIYPGTGAGSSTNPLVISTQSLADGMVGRTYSQQLAAGGGVPPYRWVVVTGNMPQGLSLSDAGFISGAPTRVGNSTFDVRVRDASGATSVSRLTIRVVGDTGDPSTRPHVTRVKRKNSKKFLVYGANLNSGSLVQLNGVTITPKKLKPGRLVVKGKFSFAEPGANTLFVINSDSRSTPFIF